MGLRPHSFLRSIADRVPVNGSLAGRVHAGLVVDGVVALDGLAVNRVLAPRSGEAPTRALGRLVATTSAVTAVAGLGANLVELGVHRCGGRLLTAAVTVGTCAALYARAHPARARAGSFSPFVPKAVGLGALVSLSLLGVALAESAVSSPFAHVAVKNFGRNVQGPQDGGPGARAGRVQRGVTVTVPDDEIATLAADDVGAPIGRCDTVGSSVRGLAVMVCL